MGSYTSTPLKRGHGVKPGARGFSILELTVSLAIIALILGAVMNGAGLFTSANYQQAHNVFVQGWLESFRRFVATQKYVPGDSPSDPTNRVAGRFSGADRLCNSETDPALSNEFLGADVGIPDGMGEGFEDEYVYHDSEGDPYRLKLCLATVTWTARGKEVGLYSDGVPRHVLWLSGVSPGFAVLLDTMIDQRVNARAGRVRLAAHRDEGHLDYAPWPHLPGSQLEVLISTDSD